MMLSTVATFALTAIVAGEIILPTSAVDYVYASNYESSDACATGSAVGVVGFVANETMTFHGADGGSCAAEMSCLLDDSSVDCAALSHTMDVSGVFAVGDSDGEIYNCVGENDCRIMDNDVCSQSAIYPHCSFKMFSFDELKEEPSLMMNDGMGATNTAYGIFFSDDMCTDAVGLVGRVSGTSFELPLVGYPEDDTGSSSTLTCEDMMVCMINPEGDACSTVKSDVPMATLNLETRGENGEDFYLCDSSNEAIGQKECEVLSSDLCIKSSLVSGCYWRAVTGYTMMKYADLVMSGGMISESGVENNEDAAGDNAITGGTDLSGIISEFSKCVDIETAEIDTDCITKVLATLDMDASILQGLAKCASTGGSFEEIQTCAMAIGTPEDMPGDNGMTDQTPEIPEDKDTSSVSMKIVGRLILFAHFAGALTCIV